MRFVPHRNVSFQHSADQIPDDYDSGYSSEEGQVDLESSLSEQVLSSPLTSSTEKQLQISTLKDVLEDLSIQDRFSIVTEVSSALLTSDSSFNQPIQSSQDQFARALELFDARSVTRRKPRSAPANYNSEHIDGPDSAVVAERMRSDISNYIADVNRIAEQLSAERKRKAEEEARKAAEEEARQKAEKERLRLLEEEKEKARIKAEEEAERKAEAKRLEDIKAAEVEKARLKKEKEEKKKRDAEAQAQAAANTIHSDVRIQKEFLKYKQDIADIKKNVVEPLMAQKELKQVTNRVRRKINPKFGQLTRSNSKLQAISTEMVGFMQEAKNFNELSYKFLLNFIAKELIKQAEVEVIVSPDHSVALAGLASILLQSIPELEYYLLARFYKKCPYLLGFTCDIDTEEGRYRMGWRKPNGKWEDESKYNERLGGIATLYSVLTRINVQAPDTNIAISMAKSWMFLSRMVNLKPELLQDIHYILVANWWDACCIEFLTIYRSQAQKLLTLIATNWLQLVENRRFSGYVRLRLLAEDWTTQNKIMSFKRLEV